MQIENFLNYLKFEKRYSVHTLVDYKTDLNQFISFILLEFEIENFKEVSQFNYTFLDFNLLDSDISSRSVNEKITTLKSLFKFLLLEDIITEKILLKRLFT